MNALQRLDELLEEWRDIATKAEKLQSGGPLNPGRPYEIQTFQDQYDTWYTAASELLPPDLKARLERELTSPPGDCGLIDFSANPTRTGPDNKGVYDADSPHVVVPTKFQFTYPYEHCFREPFLRQVQVLVEAKYHPDVGRTTGPADRGEPTVLNMRSLHPAVFEASGALFADGHFQSAILQACIALADVVREASGSADRDDTPMMQSVFSPKKPILKISEDEGERQGMMWLFSGAVMGLRNPRAHRRSIGQDLDETRAFEWLAFLSALMRILNQAERVEKPMGVPSPSGSGTSMDDE